MKNDDEQVVLSFVKPTKGAGVRYNDTAPTVRVTLKDAARKSRTSKSQINIRINGPAMKSMRWLVGDRAKVEFAQSNGHMSVRLHRTSDGFAISGSQGDKGKMVTGHVKFSVSDEQAELLLPLIGETMHAECGTESIYAKKEIGTKE